MSLKENTSVAGFYAGKSVFVTGATGFIGKVLVEKLLFSCKDIGKIYILVRNQQNASIQQRVQEITAKPIFDRIKTERPKSLEKLVPIRGDLLGDNLGISLEDEELLKDEVSVVIHSAASVRFDLRLDLALNYNYEATKKILSLCHRINNLKSYVHMSTAFIRCHELRLDEMLYPPPSSLKELQDILKNDLDDEEKVTKLLAGRPNTYTYSKALTENYLAKNHGTIPTSIIRPSIVGAAEKEPLPGWLEGWSVGNAMVAGTSLGYNRVIVGSPSSHTDFIPVDYVTNLAIVAGAKNINKGDFKIYNSSTTSCNPATLKNIATYITDFSRKNALDDFRSFCVIAKGGFWENKMYLILENIPAFFRKLTGRKPRYEKLYSKKNISRDHLKYFTSRSYNMTANNTVAFSRSLPKEDATTFPFNPQAINWKNYVQIYCTGVRKFLLKK